MRKFLSSVTLASFMVAPVQAADWQSQPMDMRPGAFVGARVHLSLGGRTVARPRAALTIAPTQTRISSTGAVRTGIGEGIALNFGPGSKPTLTLAGVRADTALGLQRDRDLDSDKKLGISTGGWVAIGIGTAALILGGLYLAADHIADCDEGECD